MEPSEGKPSGKGPGDGGGQPVGGHGPSRPGPEGEGKIIYKSDESWKAEAQREKERLQEKAAAEASRQALPPPTFLAFISNLGMEAMIALGLIEIEGGGAPKVDLASAGYIIDVLGVLQEKTRGNLGPDEKRSLDDLLMNLRIGYSRIAKAAQAEGKAIVDPAKKIIT